MANLLDKYGIKEVADVIFYNHTTNGGIDYASPVLFLDTLKVSTIEQTAENVSARGGKGNPELVTWDYNKEITLTLEDALFSAKSLQFMFGADKIDDTTKTVTQAVSPDSLDDSGTIWTSPDGNTIGVTPTYYDASNSVTTTKANAKYAIISYNATHSYTINIDSDKFPGQYAIVGDTFARPQGGGEKDEMFQFIIYNAKVSSEVTFTLEAEGDPTTFNMTIRVLKPATGKTMMSLKKYDIKS